MEPTQNPLALADPPGPSLVPEVSPPSASPASPPPGRSYTRTHDDPSVWPREGLCYIYALDDGSSAYTARLDCPVDPEDVRDAVGGGRYKLAFKKPDGTWGPRVEEFVVDGPNLRAQLRILRGEEAPARRVRGIGDQLQEALNARAAPPAPAPVAAPASSGMEALIVEMVRGMQASQAATAAALERLAESIAKSQVAPAAPAASAFGDEMVREFIQAAMKKGLAGGGIDGDLERLVRVKALVSDLGEGSDLQSVMGMMQGLMGGGGASAGPRRVTTGAAPAKRAAPATPPPAALPAPTPPASPNVPSSAGAPVQAPPAAQPPRAEEAPADAPAEDSPGEGDEEPTEEQLVEAARSRAVLWEVVSACDRLASGELQDVAARDLAMARVCSLTALTTSDADLEDLRQRPRMQAAMGVLMFANEAFPGHASVQKKAALEFVQDCLGRLFHEMPGEVEADGQAVGGGEVSP